MTDARLQTKRVRVRLLWDEQLSPDVPKALRALRVNASYVGNSADDQPKRGSTDPEIVEHAKRTNQVIVTSNHDMMLICEEARQQFVWVDPYGRTLNRRAQVVLAFEQVEAWQSILASDPEICVRALRTKCEPIAASEAARLAAQRMRELRRRRRSSASVVRAADGVGGGGLFDASV